MATKKKRNIKNNKKNNNKNNVPSSVVVSNPLLQLQKQGINSHKLVLFILLLFVISLLIILTNEQIRKRVTDLFFNNNTDEITTTTTTAATSSPTQSPPETKGTLWSGLHIVFKVIIGIVIFIIGLFIAVIIFGIFINIILAIADYFESLSKRKLEEHYRQMYEKIKQGVDQHNEAIYNAGGDAGLVDIAKGELKNYLLHVKRLIKKADSQEFHTEEEKKIYIQFRKEVKRRLNPLFKNEDDQIK